MYGIDFEVIRGDTLTDENLTFGPGPLSINDSSAFSEGELHDIEMMHHDTSAEYYFFVGDDAHPSAGSGIGMHRHHPIWRTRYTVLFTNWTQSYSHTPGHLSPEDRVRAGNQPVAAHEIGHAFELGENDDVGGEVYSGEPDDHTPEYISGRYRMWSSMTYANGGGLFVRPTGVRYTAISMEEWTTLQLSRLN